MATESKQLRKFIYIEGSDSYLRRVTNPEILANIIDPNTNLPYDGIILEGEFASMDTLNNNNRIYTEENYIQFVEQLKIQAHSPKGLYGCAEHPKTYSTDIKEVSHKILDIWYDKNQKKVFGIIMLLNTACAEGAREIIKSGGQIPVSARGGGSEIKNPDGTITAVLKLLITFDIVYHPGFSSSITEFTKLNESVPQKNYSIIYDDKIQNLLNLNESYIEDEEDNDLNQSQKTQKNKAIKSEIKHDNQVMQSGETTKKDKVENKLSNAVQQLSESQKDFHKQMNRSVGKFKKLGNSVYDNSAGFLTEDEL